MMVIPRWDTSLGNVGGAMAHVSKPERPKAHDHATGSEDRSDFLGNNSNGESHKGAAKTIGSLGQSQDSTEDLRKESIVIPPGRRNLSRSTACSDGVSAESVATESGDSPVSFSQCPPLPGKGCLPSLERRDSVGQELSPVGQPASQKSGESRSIMKTKGAVEGPETCAGGLRPTVEPGAQQSKGTSQNCGHQEAAPGKVANRNVTDSANGANTLPKVSDRASKDRDAPLSSDAVCRISKDSIIGGYSISTVNDVSHTSKGAAADHGKLTVSLMAQSVSINAGQGTGTDSPEESDKHAGGPACSSLDLGAYPPLVAEGNSTSDSSPSVREVQKSSGKLADTEAHDSVTSLAEAERPPAMNFGPADSPVILPDGSTSQTRSGKVVDETVMTWSETPLGRESKEASQDRQSAEATEIADVDTRDSIEVPGMVCGPNEFSIKAIRTHSSLLPLEEAPPALRSTPNRGSAEAGAGASLTSEQRCSSQELDEGNPFIGDKSPTLKKCFSPGGQVVRGSDEHMTGKVLGLERIGANASLVENVAGGAPDKGLVISAGKGAATGERDTRSGEQLESSGEEISDPSRVKSGALGVEEVEAAADVQCQSSGQGNAMNLNCSQMSTFNPFWMKSEWRPTHLFLQFIGPAPSNEKAVAAKRVRLVDAHDPPVQVMVTILDPGVYILYVSAGPRWTPQLPHYFPFEEPQKVTSFHISEELFVGSGETAEATCVRCGAQVRQRRKTHRSPLTSGRNPLRVRSVPNDGKPSGLSFVADVTVHAMVPIEGFHPCRLCKFIEADPRLAISMEVFEAQRPGVTQDSVASKEESGSTSLLALGADVAKTLEEGVSCMAREAEHPREVPSPEDPGATGSRAPGSGTAEDYEQMYIGTREAARSCPGEDRDLETDTRVALGEGSRLMKDSGEDVILQSCIVRPSEEARAVSASQTRVTWEREGTQFSNGTRVTSTTTTIDPSVNPDEHEVSEVSRMTVSASTAQGETIGAGGGSQIPSVDSCSVIQTSLGPKRPSEHTSDQDRQSLARQVGEAMCPPGRTCIDNPVSGQDSLEESKMSEGSSGIPLVSCPADGHTPYGQSCSKADGKDPFSPPGLSLPSVSTSGVAGNGKEAALPLDPAPSSSSSTVLRIVESACTGSGVSGVKSISLEPEEIEGPGGNRHNEESLLLPKVFESAFHSKPEGISQPGVVDHFRAQEKDRSVMLASTLVGNGDAMTRSAENDMSSVDSPAARRDAEHGASQGVKSNSPSLSLQISPTNEAVKDPTEASETVKSRVVDPPVAPCFTAVAGDGPERTEPAGVNKGRELQPSFVPEMAAPVPSENAREGNSGECSRIPPAPPSAVEGRPEPSNAGHVSVTSGMDALAKVPQSSSCSPRRDEMYPSVVKTCARVDASSPLSSAHLMGVGIGSFRSMLVAGDVAERNSTSVFLRSSSTVTSHQTVKKFEVDGVPVVDPVGGPAAPLAEVLGISSVPVETETLAAFKHTVGSSQESVAVGAVNATVQITGIGVDTPVSVHPEGHACSSEMASEAATSTCGSSPNPCGSKQRPYHLTPTGSNSESGEITLREPVDPHVQLSITTRSKDAEDVTCGLSSASDTDMVQPAVTPSQPAVGSARVNSSTLTNVNESTTQVLFEQCASGWAVMRGSNQKPSAGRIHDSSAGAKCGEDACSDAPTVGNPPAASPINRSSSAESRADHAAHSPAELTGICTVRHKPSTSQVTPGQTSRDSGDPRDVPLSSEVGVASSSCWTSKNAEASQHEFSPGREPSAPPVPERQEESQASDGTGVMVRPSPTPSSGSSQGMTSVATCPSSTVDQGLPSSLGMEHMASSATIYCPNCGAYPWLDQPPSADHGTCQVCLCKVGRKAFTRSDDDGDGDDDAVPYPKGVVSSHAPEDPATSGAPSGQSDSSHAGKDGMTREAGEYLPITSAAEVRTGCNEHNRTGSANQLFSGCGSLEGSAVPAWNTKAPRTASSGAQRDEDESRSKVVVSSLPGVTVGATYSWNPALTSDTSNSTATDPSHSSTSVPAKLPCSAQTTATLSTNVEDPALRASRAAYGQLKITSAAAAAGSCSTTEPGSTPAASPSSLSNCNPERTMQCPWSAGEPAVRGQEEPSFFIRSSRTWCGGVVSHASQLTTERSSEEGNISQIDATSVTQEVEPRSASLAVPFSAGRASGLEGKANTVIPKDQSSTCNASMEGGKENPDEAVRTARAIETAGTWRRPRTGPLVASSPNSVDATTISDQGHVVANEPGRGGVASKANGECKGAASDRVSDMCYAPPLLSTSRPDGNHSRARRQGAEFEEFECLTGESNGIACRKRKRSRRGNQMKAACGAEFEGWRDRSTRAVSVGRGLLNATTLHVMFKWCDIGERRTRDGAGELSRLFCAVGDPIVPSDTAWCAPKPGSRPPHDPLLPDREQTAAFASVKADLWGPGSCPVWSKDVHWARRGGGLHAAACGVDSPGVFLGGRGDGEKPPERGREQSEARSPLGATEGRGLPSSLM